MRIANSTQFYRALNGMLDTRAQIARAQEQISTGKRLAGAADDPAAAARILDIGERLAAIDQYTRNADLLELRLSDQETAIDGAVNLLQRVRELAIQGRNGSLSVADRRFIASEVSQRVDELKALANAQNASGEYIFGGTAVDTRPFVTDGGGAVVYQGNDNVRSLDIAEGRSMVESHSGTEVFMAVRNGNGTFVTRLGAANTGSARPSNDTLVDPTAYVPHDFRISFTAADTFDVIDDTTGATVLAGQAYEPGATVSFNGLSLTLNGAPAAGDEFFVEPSANQPVFATLDALVATLREAPADDAGRTRFSFAMDRGLQDIDRALENMLEVRAAIGAKANALTAQRNANEDLSIQLAKAKSSLEDADPVRAISDLARHSQALEAAQQAFVKVQGLSLFNFLR